MGMSIWHGVIVLVYLASVTIPFVKIFPRAGLPAWLGVVGLVPFAPLIFLWLLAFKKWPDDK
jgi:hypothetical protein